MGKFATSVLFLAAVTAAVPGCGSVRGGGIVDNGDKPTTPSDQNGTAAGADAAIQVLTVLGRYDVVVPAGWSSVNAATIASSTDQMTFSLSRAACDAGSDQPPATEVTPSNATIAWCSATETVVALAGADVRVDHSARDAAIIGILRSIQLHVTP